MQDFLDKSSLHHYSQLVNLEKRFQSLNFRNFFYKRLEIEYNLGKNDIYGLVAEFRIYCIQFHSQLSSLDLENSQKLLLGLQSILEKLENSEIYLLLNLEFKTLSYLIQAEIGLKELEFKKCLLALYRGRMYFRKWIQIYKEKSQLQKVILKILDLQLQKFRFLFSIGSSRGIENYKNNGYLGERFGLLVKNSLNMQLLVIGITENGFHSRYTCMPSISAKTGLGLFPIIYSSHDLKVEIILPNVISLLYSWEKLGCLKKKLGNSSNYKHVHVKNQFLSWGQWILFKDFKLKKVWEIFCLDSRIFVVLMTGLKEYSSAQSEEILAQIVSIWK